MREHGAPDRVRSERTGGDRAAPGTPTVRPGDEVYTLDAAKRGGVGDAADDYFTVKRGLLQSELYISFEEIRDIWPGVVYVNVTADQLELKHWREPPLHPEHRSAGPTSP